MSTTPEAITEDPPPAPSTRSPGPVPALAEAASYVLAIVLLFWPAVAHARNEIIGGGEDARYYTWLGWRIGRLIGHGHVLPVRITDVIVPFGLDLRLLDGNLPSYVTGLFNLVAGPVLAYNLAFVTGAVLNILAARALAQRLSPSRLVHAIAAIAFLTAPPLALLVQVGVLPLFWAFTLPLLVADALDVVTGAREVRPVRLVLLLVVAYLCSVYFLIFGGLAYGLIVLVAAVRRRTWRIPVAVASALGVTLIALLPFVIPRFSFDRDEQARGGESELIADSEVFSADALSIVAQPTRSTILFPRPTVIDKSVARLPDPNGVLEATMFPGLLLLAGFVVFLLSRDRRRLPLSLAAAAMYVLALGPSLKVGGAFVWKHGGEPVAWLPYRLLIALPGLGALRVPLRTSAVFVALLTAATAIALHRVLATRLPRSAVVVGCAALLAMNLVVPLPTLTMAPSADSERALRAIRPLARPGDTVIRVPFDCDPNFTSLQVLHHTAVVGCAGSFAANPWSKMGRYARSPGLAKLRCDPTKYGRLESPAREDGPFGPDDLAEIRREFGARFVVLDRRAIGYGCVANSALPFLEQHRSLGGDDRFEVLDLATPAGG